MLLGNRSKKFDAPMSWGTDHDYEALPIFQRHACPRWDVAVPTGQSTPPKPNEQLASITNKDKASKLFPGSVLTSLSLSITDTSEVYDDRLINCIICLAGQVLTSSTKSHSFTAFHASTPTITSSPRRRKCLSGSSPEYVLSWGRRRWTRM